MNDDLRDLMPTSEEFYASMAPAPVDENGMTPDERDEYESEYNAYLDSIGTSFAEVQEKSRQFADDLENAYKCDDDEDDHDSMNDGHGTLADDAWHDANEYPEW